MLRIGVREDPAVRARELSALAHPARFDIPDMVGERCLTAGTLSDRFPPSRRSVRKHIGVLATAGLVERRRIGRALLQGLEGALDMDDDIAERVSAWPSTRRA